MHQSVQEAAAQRSKMSPWLWIRRSHSEWDWTTLHKLWTWSLPLPLPLSRRILSEEEL